jgi:DNA polymerase III alpha subunit
MYKNKFGQLVYNESEICDLYLTDPEKQYKNFISEDRIPFNKSLTLENIPDILNQFDTSVSVAEFDEICQNKWHMPIEYKEMDIAKYVLDQCKSEAELQRAGQELLLFQERNMFTLLKYLKYLVDTMRSNNIVWGVGRGSSVSSFVLYLIGIHRINSLYYDLSIEEFLK